MFNRMRLALKIVGSIIGLLALMLSAPIAYGFLLQLSQGLTVVFGPGPVLIWVAAMQYVGYAFMGIIVFRYLSRLRPFYFSLRSGQHEITSASWPAFWLNLALCALFANLRAHRDGLSLPTLTFDVVMVSFLLYHYSPARLHCLKDGTSLALFLRPFSSFSDRSLVNGLLNSLPSSTQVVFVVPRQESLRNWDPYTIGLAGFRFTEPLRSTPISLCCDDNEWVECVRYLVEKSAVILVDASTITTSLDIELGLIRRAEACSRTIVFREKILGSDTRVTSGLAGTDGWLDVLTFKRGLNIPRIVLALGLTVGALWAVWLSIFGQWALPGLVKIAMATIASLFVLHHWSVVFLKKTVRQSVFRATRKLLGPIKPRGRTYQITRAATFVASIAFLSVLWFVCSFLYSTHVVIGDSFSVTRKVWLVDVRQVMEGDLENPIDVAAVSSMAKWSVIPKEMVLDEVDTHVAKEEISWWDGDPHSSDAIVFRMRGRVRVLPSSPTGEAILLFSLPESTALPVNSAQPRVLVDRWPMDPVVLQQMYYWSAGGWVVHESRQQANIAAIKQITAGIAALAGVLLAVIVGFRVVKH